jgi:hypothetical protein
LDVPLIELSTPPVLSWRRITYSAFIAAADPLPAMLDV